MSKKLKRDIDKLFKNTRESLLELEEDFKLCNCNDPCVVSLFLFKLKDIKQKVDKGINKLEILHE